MRSRTSAVLMSPLFATPVARIASTMIWFISSAAVAPWQISLVEISAISPLSMVTTLTSLSSPVPVVPSA